jgi:acetate kinase
MLLAHLGSGASMAAVCGGRAVDTTMALTPAAGLVMGTRPGDMDPGLLTYLMRTEDLSSAETEEFINRQCGLAGVSGRSSDMRDLLARRESDAPAAEAVELFCYRARQWIGALAASMGGIDTLVFSAGIGERSPEVRAEICAGLEFLGIAIDAARNAAGEAVISTESSPVTVRVIATDEELTIARVVCDILGMPVDNPSHEARV